MPEKQNISAIILCGGLNTRMNGQPKGLLKLGQETFLQRTKKILNSLCNEILLVTRTPELYLEYNLKIVQDIYKARSSLTGIHAGLNAAKNQYSIVVPCDTPFLKQKLLRLLLLYTKDHFDVIVPENLQGLVEPLCAVYAKDCLPIFEKNLKAGIFKISKAYEKLCVKRVPAPELRFADPLLESFININTRKDLLKISLNDFNTLK